MIKEKAHCVISLLSALFLCLLTNVLFVYTLSAEEVNAAALQGPAFSDPSKQVTMPDEWIRKPVTHDPAYPDADLVVFLDGQLYKAWIPLIEKFAEKNSLKISISHGTCGVSAGGLTKKTIDVGAFCCPAGETDRLPGLKFHTIGIAAQALLVHPDNPVDNITFEQAQQIFQGRLYRWSEIKNDIKPDRLIQPVGRLHCKLRPGHWRLLLADKDLFSPDLFEVGAMPDMISQVAGNPGAIGHEILWMPQFLHEFGAVKILELNGFSPDEPSHLLSGEYPLYRVYNLSTWEDEHAANPFAGKLVEYIIREAGNLDKKYHLIPASSLRKAGWKFKDAELVGGPDHTGKN